jgi:3'-phosphoadenosine 5'-phosphosulfate sulfotransferase (PAPS reductase)/FAD synthetase
MVSDPFFITGPALISFSGGRTSAYMLWRILQAHGGTLPDDVHVCFANTGKEREETLRFVHECSVRWGVRVRWLEWINRPDSKVPPSERFIEVGFNSAARKGEPFKALVRRKKYLPNAVTRFCTAELKIDTMKQFMLAQGYERWTNVVGLRRDEMHRVFKQYERNESGKERWRSHMPMATRAGATTSRDIWRFWLGQNVDPKKLRYPLPQGFDLGLWPYEGNCDDCFLKGLAVLVHQERERPGTAADWIGMEDEVAELTSNPNGARFVTEYSYREIVAIASQPLLFPLETQDLELDAECGLWCSPEQPQDMDAYFAEVDRLAPIARGESA